MLKSKFSTAAAVASTTLLALAIMILPERLPLSPAQESLATEPVVSGIETAALKPAAGVERRYAEAAKQGTQPDKAVRVRAPETDVRVDKERGNVRVRAPHTAVNVDPDKGRVRVRAPYVNLDIRW